jgi:hypothetical protein
MLLENKLGTKRYQKRIGRVNSSKLSLQGGRPFPWMLWHPYQGLWNWDMVKAINIIFSTSIVNKLIIRMIIVIDTAILFIQALVRRATKVGVISLIHIDEIPHDISILYFDMGTDAEAKELSLMVDRILPHICKNFKAYGFEAIYSLFKQAESKFIKRENVKLTHGAISHTIANGSRIKVYKDSKGTGGGNSIYRPYFGDYEEVKAIRFSDWLYKNNINLKNSICILRMNIEGAEFDVISDLIENGLTDYIDGYFGMWDDVLKINAYRDYKFRNLLAKNAISPFTFNGRDFCFGFRLKCIEYEINTSIQAGLQRIKKGPRQRIRAYRG